MGVFLRRVSERGPLHQKGGSFDCSLWAAESSVVTTKLKGRFHE